MGFPFLMKHFIAGRVLTKLFPCPRCSLYAPPTEPAPAAAAPAAAPPEPFDNTTYKNLQHHDYNVYTFLDVTLDLSSRRLPQPSSGRESPRHWELSLMVTLCCPLRFSCKIKSARVVRPGVSLVSLLCLPSEWPVSSTMAGHVFIQRVFRDFSGRLWLTEHLHKTRESECFLTVVLCWALRQLSINLGYPLTKCWQMEWQPLIL